MSRYLGRSAEDPDLADLFARLPVAPGAKQDLLARLGDPARRYHGLHHVALLWRRHRAYGAGSDLCGPPWHGLLACAIAFHDAVYDPRRHDSEARSAAVWRESRPALDPAAVEWVAGTVLATADHLGAGPEPGMDAAAWRARVWMLDLDLTPLGEAPAEFEANTARLRAEYAHLSDAAWAAGRRAFLRGVASRGALYRSPALAAAFEVPARANLTREIAAADARAGPAATPDRGGR